MPEDFIMLVAQYLHGVLLSLLTQIVTNKYFEGFIVLMAIASCVVLALDDIATRRGDNPTKATVLRNLDAAFTAVFGVEVRGITAPGSCYGCNKGCMYLLHPLVVPLAMTMPSCTSWGHPLGVPLDGFQNRWAPTSATVFMWCRN